MNNVSNSSFNISAFRNPQFKPWTYISIFSLAILVLATFFNSIILFLFARNANLRTPFTIYVINLLVANLVNLLYQQPLRIVSYLYSSTYLGRPFCEAYLYGSYAVQAAVYCAHFAISLNRMWAVTNPITYRLYHTKKFAIVSCLLVWAYVHAVVLPGLIINTLYYKLPLEAGCYVARNPLLTWTIAEQLMMYDIPLGLLVLAYPVICLTEVRRRIRRNQLFRVSPGSDGNKNSAPRALTGPPSRQGTGDHGRGSAGTNTQTSNAFILLTILTFSNCVSLVPLTVAYNLSIAFSSSEELLRWLAGWSAAKLYVVTPMLFYVEALVDPILFTLALRDVRTVACSALSKGYNSFNCNF